MEEIAFDVVIPTYKTNPIHLKEAVESVFNQSYENWHIYISEGTDVEHDRHVSKHLDEFDSNRITILQQQGKGISNARNQATFAGSNPFVALLDSDDLWYVDKLEKYASHIAENPDVDIMWGCAIADGTFVSPKGNQYGMKKKYGIMRRLHKTLNEHLHFRIKWHPLMTSTQVYSRKALETVQIKEGHYWDETIAIGEDTELNVRLSKQCHNHHQFDDPVGDYRVHMEQTTKGGESIGVKEGLSAGGYDEPWEVEFERFKETYDEPYDGYWEFFARTVSTEISPYCYQPPDLPNDPMSIYLRTPTMQFGRMSYGAIYIGETRE